MNSQAQATPAITAEANPANTYHNKLNKSLTNEALMDGFRRSRKSYKTGWAK